MFYRMSRKTLILILIASVSLWGYGCSSHRSLPIEKHLDLYTKKIAIVPSRLPIQHDLDLYAKGRLEGALKGAGTGAVATLGALGSGGSCQGALCGAVVLIYLGAAVVGGTVGAVYGAVTSPSGNKVADMEFELKDKTPSTITQKVLSQLLFEKTQQNTSLDVELVSLSEREGKVSVPEYEQLRTQGFQELISANLLTVEFQGGKGQNPPLALTITTIVNIIDLEAPEKVIRREFEYEGPPQYFKEWIAKDPEELKQDFAVGLASIVDDIYDDIFMNIDLPISSGYTAFPGSDKFGCCWICPEDPPLDYSFWKRRLEYPVVDSLTPRISWEAFPDKQQAKDFENATGREIENVHYDLKVWKGVGKLIYQSVDIEENYHELESDLEANTKYHWSVRACFMVADKEVCTRWASSTVPYLDGSSFKDYCDRQHTLPDNYYRFKTP